MGHITLPYIQQTSNKIWKTADELNSFDTEIQESRSPPVQLTAAMVSQAEHSTTGQDQGSALNFRAEARLHTGLVNGDG